MARGNPVNGWHRQADSMVIAKTPLRQIRGIHHHAEPFPALPPTAQPSPAAEAGGR